MPFAVADDGIRIHYEVTGITKRAPVLLVQGLGGGFVRSGGRLIGHALALFCLGKFPLEVAHGLQGEAIGG